MDTFLAQMIFIIIIINPVNQMMLILAIAEKYPDREVSRLILTGNMWAFIITALIAVTGLFLFTVVFRVDLATLRLAGGLILGGIGYIRVTRGVTFQMKRTAELSELQVVPFAVPMVVGPATFAQAVTITADYGVWFSLGVVAAVLALNTGLMMLTLLLKRWINRNVVSATIRLSGLVTMTIGLQMIYSSIVELIRLAA